ncbi:GNAT family N-acetyltransferase [Rhodococcus daqingensis]|uniref:GNAT family N-acetyltransferase n=1 Tax=Rhodococcus daqingensis TaxID=2479363 RepID=A0ABW2RTB8_9NOCA
MTGPWFEQPTLTGKYVRLEPLTLAHAADLHRAADDPTLFHWTWRPIETVADATEYIRHALDDPQRLAYAQIATESGAAVGTTSYYQLDPLHQSLAIGYTWLSRAAQGGRINPEAKLLLLRRAFEDLGAVRVEWHTDELNAHSRGAIAKLGAEFEGLLRKHRRRADGSWRNTALFSMIDDDWPLARAQLEARISE